MISIANSSSNNSVPITEAIKSLEFNCQSNIETENAINTKGFLTNTILICNASGKLWFRYHDMGTKLNWNWPFEC